jgi:hypothetical protein
LLLLAVYFTMQSVSQTNQRRQAQSKRADTLTSVPTHWSRTGQCDSLERWRQALMPAIQLLKIRPYTRYVWLCMQRDGSSAQAPYSASYKSRRTWNINGSANVQSIDNAVVILLLTIYIYYSLNLVMIVLNIANLTCNSYTNTRKRFTPNCNFTVHFFGDDSFEYCKSY